MAGHTEGKVTLYTRDNILASTAVLEIISITIDTSVRDAGNPEGSTNLRAGLALSRDAATGKYVATTAGDSTADPVVAGTEKDAVILQHPVNGIDKGDQQASAYYIATVWEDALISEDTLDWDANSRISVMKRV